MKYLSFSGKSEDFPAWSTRFLAYMQTKGLYKTAIGKDDVSKTGYEEHNNSVWCHLALCLDETSLLYIRHDCVKTDGSGDGAKAWKMLKERFSSVEKPTVISIMGQLARLEMKPDEPLDEYCIKCQQLVNRLKEAGEELSDTLFNALVINGLPERFEHFVVQESFNPCASFTELRKRMRNFEDSRQNRTGSAESESVAMSTQKKKDSAKAGKCYCCGMAGHFARSCKYKNSICRKCEKKGHLEKVCSQQKSTNSAEVSTARKEATAMAMTVSSLRKKWQSDSFIVDSGCTDHIVTCREAFDRIEPSTCAVVKNPNGSEAAIKGRGDVRVNLEADGELVEVVLKNVLYVPEYNVNLLSVMSASQRGSTFVFDSNPRIVLPDGTNVKMRETDKLYHLRVSFLGKPARCAYVSRDKDYWLWHRRLGHVNKQDLSQTVGGCAASSDTCEVCVVNKMIRRSIPEVNPNRAKKARERVYSDVLGPMEQESFDGHRYAVTFVDDFTNFAVVKFMKRKSEVLEAFESYVADHGVPMILRSDNGGEYTSKAFKKKCRELRVKQEFTVPGTPEQNGVAERYNRTVVEMGRCLLQQAKLSKQYWVRADRKSVV